MTADEIRTLHYAQVSIFEEDDHSITETFHEYSKFSRENIADLGQRVGIILRDPKIRAMMAASWKTYRGHERIPLPPPALGSMTLEESLQQRKSLSSDPGASFSGEPITIAQLGSVLGMSYGITRAHRIPGTDQTQHFRTTTSAGGLYPLEIYPIVLRVDGLAEGIYHYSVPEHALELVRRGPCLKDFLNVTNYVDMCQNASVVLAVSAVFKRNMSKYLHRGYRFIMNDAGALLQSFYLCGTALRLGTCALGGFFDDPLGDLLGINNVDEAPVICFLLGRLE